MAKCTCWAGRNTPVRMTVKLLAQRAACPVHSKRRTHPPVADSNDDEIEVPYVMWRQRDGTLIAIKDMDDHHLYCAIRMLERKADYMLIKAEERQRGCAADEHFDHTRSQFLKPIYYAMVKVAEARGIML